MLMQLKNITYKDEHEAGNIPPRAVVPLDREQEPPLPTENTPLPTYMRLASSTAVEGVESKPVLVTDMPAIVHSAAPLMMALSRDKNIPVAGRIDPEYHRGTALAGIQVGIPARFFIARFDHQDRDRCAVIFNPSYAPSGKSVKTVPSLENCLTYPMQSYTVRRYKVIRAKYQNHEGEEITMRLTGRDAVLFQQMTDLMDGITIKKQERAE
jgi:peptide deformylase